MRFNAQELTGSRARFHYSVELAYDVAGASAFLCNVHAARTSRQSVLEECFATSPPRPFTLEQDADTCNRIAAFDTGAGGLVVRYAAVVDVAHRIVDPRHVVAESPSALPVATLRFLYPSRYCQADLVQQQAWDSFGSLPRGYVQVRGRSRLGPANVRFRPGASRTGRRRSIRCAMAPAYAATSLMR